ncbi:hypothetical protein PybrP1_006869 [[Pythium] brassicae (nom. inval.)]|nr:hypothetical protein PybrP1_006869 [[Pythium] brassicae (nom. inval.)]
MSVTCVKRTSALALVVVNVALLAAAAVVLYVALHIRGTAWVDVVRSYVSATDTVLTAIVAVAATLIALAALGSAAAICRWRLGLLLYVCASVLFLLAFVAIAVAAFLLRNTASDWDSVPFPAADDELAVKREFDTLYCAAQGEYICNSLTVNDAVAMFAPQYNSSSLLQSFAGVKGVGALCATFGSQVADLKAVCDGCAVASEFKNLSGVFDWTNDQCPRTQQTLLWCGVLLRSGSVSGSTDSITAGTAPYTECRDEFLGLIESTGLYLGLGSIFVSVGAMLAIGMSCYLRRRESSRGRGSSSDGDGDDPYTPTATHAMFHKA